MFVSSTKQVNSTALGLREITAKTMRNLDSGKLLTLNLLSYGRDVLWASPWSVYKMTNLHLTREIVFPCFDSGLFKHTSSNYIKLRVGSRSTADPGRS